MSVFVYDAVDTVMYGTKKIYVMFSLKCMSSGQKNNTGIIVPFNFVWAARQWPPGDRRRMRKWHGCQFAGLCDNGAHAQCQT